MTYGSSRQLGTCFLPVQLASEAMNSGMRKDAVNEGDECLGFLSETKRLLAYELQSLVPM